MRDFVPIAADEWPVTDELWRMLHTALQAGAFTARKQLLYCAGARRLFGDLPAEYRPIIDDVEVYADRPDLPLLQVGEKFPNVNLFWRRGDPRHPGTPVADCLAGLWAACMTILDQHIAERLPPGATWIESEYPQLELDELCYYAVVGDVFASSTHDGRGSIRLSRPQADLVREVLGNPLRPVVFDGVWWTDTVMSLARGVYESRDFSAMPILADALQDAGCDNDDVLNHCRGPLTHFRGCWVVDQLLGKV